MVQVSVSLDVEQYSLLAQVAEANGFGDMSMSQLLGARIDTDVRDIRASGGAE